MESTACADATVPAPRSNDKSSHSPDTHAPVISSAASAKSVESVSNLKIALRSATEAVKATSVPPVIADGALPSAKVGTSATVCVKLRSSM